MNRSTLVRTLVLVGTIALSWGVLSVGTNAGDPTLVGGDRATRDFIARGSAEVVDSVRTETERARVAGLVPVVLRTDPQREEDILGRLDQLLRRVGEISAPESTPAAGIPDPVAPAPLEETSTSEAQPIESVPLDVFVFVDVNGDGLYQTEPESAWMEDVPLAEVSVVAVDEAGVHYGGVTRTDGEVEIEVPPGSYRVYVDTASEGYPAGFRSADGLLHQLVDCQAIECDPLEGVGLTPMLPPFDSRVAELSGEAPGLDTATIEALTRFAEQDLVRTLVDEPTALSAISTEVNNRLASLFQTGVEETEVEALAGQARNDRRIVNIDGVNDDAAQAAVNDMTAELIDNNLVVDQVATDQARTASAEAVEPITETYRADDVIVADGQVITALDIAAINETGAFVERTQRRYGMLGMLTVLVAVLAYHLARFRQQFWHRIRMVGLLGLLIVIAAAAVRASVSLAETSGTLYIIPAVALGYLAAVLFDNRVGMMLSLAVAVLTAIGTFDPGATVYAGLATLAPVGFVSAVSTRRAFRNSVVIASVASAAIAASASWFFDVNPGSAAWDQVWPDAAWAGGVSLVAALLVLAAMPFFEAMFDVTTTLRLLELTDRNHEALQLIQDNAFGTFNHSLMVGTLADAAARSIGANTLLARAAAYFHDIGKTENPTFFIENQFGIPNPHDELSPEQSAEMIRRHVVDGIDLARRYRIPSDVAEGILAHHGDGIMRYFYERARQLYGAENVDPDLYRHAGHKPRSREMAIVMMADSVEGACRAVFGDEEPTRDSIEKVVNRVIDEKSGDGQLSECDLTFGELTKVRQAFTDSLIGHYHQRIPYPNFPGG